MSYTDLKWINNLSELSLVEIIEENLVSFFEWGLVNVGAFFNIRLGSSGVYGGDFSRLRPVQDPRFTNGQVWEGYRKDWVWQSGLSISTQPIQVSGVYVNSTFYPLSTSGTYSHSINYPLGRVVFNTAIPTTSTVQAEFSPKYVQVASVRDVPFFKEIQLNSFRIDNPTFLQAGSGDWGVLADMRAQLPLIGVEEGRIEYVGHELGGSTRQYTDFVFHVLGEDDAITKRLASYISQQKEKMIYLYDPNMMYNNGQSILDYKGSIVAGTKTYPQLVQPSGDGGYRFHRLTFFDTESQGGDWISESLHHSVVRITTEVIGRGLPVGN